MNSTTEKSEKQAAGKYLTVTLAGESYGIAALKVREIIRAQKITPVPQMPDFIKGVINLRGRVVPIVDLRLKFGLEAVVTERTCIVVVELAAPAGTRILLGLVVDCVEEVVNFTAGDISPPPDFGTAFSPDYLLGLAKVQGQVKTLLDIDRALTSEATQTLASLT